ncbi:MAG TPA: FecR domain-containing protein [Cyclobacteriaceae bacterium]|nr:FecR domain-containing protein [Cyclobacteriaceae bacterium]
MKKELDKEILRKFVAGKCSEEERFVVLKWIKESGDGRSLEDFLSYHWDNLDADPGDNVNHEKVFDSLDKHIKKTRTRTIFAEYSTFLKIAATFVGIVMVIAIAYLTNSSTRVYSTQYGEISRFYLPDSSEVLLNGNSKITFNSNWNDHDAREVALEGEGFFSVKHTANDQKFIVNTSESVFIEVLGTQFNVSNRQNKTKVTLKEGSIRLNILNRERKNASHETLMMVPGELVSLKKDNDKYEKKLVNTELYTSWSQNKLMLDYTPLGEIVNYLKVTNGLDVSVSDPELLNIKGSGTMPTTDPDLLVTIVAETFNLKVNKTGNKIYFFLD